MCVKPHNPIPSRRGWFSTLQRNVCSTSVDQKSPVFDTKACPRMVFHHRVPLPLLLPYSTVFFYLCIWMSPYHAFASLAEQAFGSYLEFWLKRPKGKKNCTEVVETIYDPSKMAPTSVSNTYKVCYNNHMQWICTWMNSSHDVTDKLAKRAFWLQFWKLPISLWVRNLPGGKQQHIAVVEVKDPTKMTPTSLSHIYKVFHNFKCYGCAHGWVRITLLLVSLAMPLQFARIPGTSGGATKRIV